MGRCDYFQGVCPHGGVKDVRKVCQLERCDGHGRSVQELEEV